MCNTKTSDVKSTIKQIKKLEEEGCEIIRVAVPDLKSVKALGKIIKTVPEKEILKALLEEIEKI